MTAVSGTLTGAGQSSPWEYFGGGTAVIAVSGTFAASVAIQMTLDNGTTTIPAPADGQGTPSILTAIGGVAFDIPATGLGVRVSCTAYTSGTVEYRTLWEPALLPIRISG